MNGQLFNSVLYWLQILRAKQYWIQPDSVMGVLRQDNSSGQKSTLWIKLQKIYRCEKTFEGSQRLRLVKVFFHTHNNIKMIIVPPYQGLRAHLSKGTSDLKQKCTQLATPFWSTVFHALSHGVFHFVRSVRSRNHFLIGWSSSTANQKLPFQGF